MGTGTIIAFLCAAIVFALVLAYLVRGTPRPKFEVVEVPGGFVVRLIDDPDRLAAKFISESADPKELKALRDMAERECRLANNVNASG
jgi:hypothetical protein